MAVQVTVLPDPDPFTSSEQEVYYIDIGFVREPLGTVSGSLLFPHKLSPSMTLMDFSTRPPTTRTIGRDVVRSYTNGDAQHDAKSVLITGRGIFAYDVTSGSLEWAPLRMPQETKKLDTSSVTADEDGHIFVYGSETRGIVVVTTEGEFQEILFREGHEGIGEIQKVKWCKTLNSLAVAHKKHRKIHISLVDVNLWSPLT